MNYQLDGLMKMIPVMLRLGPSHALSKKRWNKQDSRNSLLKMPTHFKIIVMLRVFTD